MKLVRNKIYVEDMINLIYPNDDTEMTKEKLQVRCPLIKALSVSSVDI